MKSFLCEGCMLASSGDSLPKIPNIFFKKHKGVINTFIHLIVFLSQLVLIVRSTTGSGAGLFERAGPSGLALNENYPPRPDGRGYPMSPLRGLHIEKSDSWCPEPNRSRNHNWYGVIKQSETEPIQFMAPIVNGVSPRWGWQCFRHVPVACATGYMLSSPRDCGGKDQ